MPSTRQRETILSGFAVLLFLSSGLAGCLGAAGEGTLTLCARGATAEGFSAVVLKVRGVDIVRDDDGRDEARPAGPSFDRSGDLVQGPGERTGQNETSEREIGVPPGPAPPPGTGPNGTGSNATENETIERDDGRDYPQPYGNDTSIGLDDRTTADDGGEEVASNATRGRDENAAGVAGGPAADCVEAPVTGAIAGGNVSGPIANETDTAGGANATPPAPPPPLGETNETNATTATNATNATNANRTGGGEVAGAGGAEGSQSLSSESRTVDLVRAANATGPTAGTRILLASADLEEGTVQTIRIMVDEAYAVRSDGTRVDLTIPGNVIVVQGPFVIEEDRETFVIVDLDLSRSLAMASTATGSATFQPAVTTEVETVEQDDDR
ncbi:MAG: DUF4382 domain-containing protein [Methanobacteriota archaeon]